MMGPRQALSRQHGAEVVEFVILLPLVLLLLLGIVEVAFGFFDQAILTTASRAAAREAVRAAPQDFDYANWNPAGDAEQAARTAAQRMFSWDESQTLGDDFFAIDVDPLAADSGDPVTVTLTYPYSFNVLGPLNTLFGGFADLTLTAQTVMRIPPRDLPASP
jgi:Flp pilus assembly protein TadG